LEICGTRLTRKLRLVIRGVRRFRSRLENGMGIMKLAICKSMDYMRSGALRFSSPANVTFTFCRVIVAPLVPSLCQHSGPYPHPRGQALFWCKEDYVPIDARVDTSYSPRCSWSARQGGPSDEVTSKHDKLSTCIVTLRKSTILCWSLSEGLAPSKADRVFIYYEIL
jgi:hypothetical protein